MIKLDKEVWKKLNIRGEALKLVSYLFSINRDGIFGEWINLDNNTTYGNIMVDDLGDTSPFAFFVISNIKKDEDSSDFINSYTKNIIDNFQADNGLFITKGDISKYKNKAKSITIYNADKMSDISLGLNLMYELTGDKYYLVSSERFLIGLIKNMVLFRKYIVYKKLSILKLPFVSGKWCGLYMEELVRYYQLSNKKKFLDAAVNQADFWINTAFFREHGLFSFESLSWMKFFLDKVFKKSVGIPLNSAMSSKANSNLIFGLSKLYSASKDEKIKNALTKWTNSAQNFLMHKRGYFYVVWSPKEGKDFVLLACDHAMIDALLEIWLSTGHELAFEMAKKNLDFWFSKQSESGLFPQSVEGEKISSVKKFHFTNPNFSRLDIQTDFGVMLLKMYELTGKRKYLDACERLIEGVLKYHKYKGAFVDIVDTKTRKKISKKIETKYLFLLLKLFIAYDYVIKNNKIYENHLMKNLLRDR